MELFAKECAERYKVSERDFRLFKQFKNKIKNNLLKSNNPVQAAVQFSPSPSQAKCINIINNHLDIKFPDQLLLLVIGEGGVGKTALISQLKKIISKKRKRFYVTALTGAQAYVHKSRTIHSLFGLRLKDSFRFDPNHGTFPQTARQRLSGIDYFVVDEVFLLGLNALNYIDKAFRLIKNKQTPFGQTRGVILVGDIGQLEAICDTSFFSSICPPELVLTQQLYQRFRPVILEENYRTRDPVFINLLRAFRFKRVTQEHVNLLRTRLSSNVSQEERNLFVNAKRVFPYNYMCQNWHNQKLIREEVKSLKFKSILKQDNKRQDTNITRGLKDYSLNIYPGAKVFLTTNINVSLGLVNGRTGTIIRPIYSDKNNKHPEFILVKFDDWTKEQMWEGIPIALETEEFNSENFPSRKYKARKFPLRQNDSVTLHKIQGHTIDKLCVNFTSTEKFNNFSYCALSRVRNLTDLLIEDNNLELSRFTGPGFLKGFDCQKEELIRLGVLEKE